MDEIYHYVLSMDLKRLGIPERKIVNRARELLPGTSIMRVLEVMERAGMLQKTAIDIKTGDAMWKAVVKAQD